MAHLHRPPNHQIRRRLSARRERGAALILSLVFVVVTSMVVGASLYLSSSHYGLALTEDRSESALLLAEGGLNDELTYIAKNAGSISPTGICSQPLVQDGETAVYPGETHAVWGRKGSINGAKDEVFWVCTTQNEWWKSGATPVPWNGKASNFWITATANVNGSWRRVEVQSTGLSVFAQFAAFALSDSTFLYAIGLDSANVQITGSVATNGTIESSGGTLSANHAVNANAAAKASGQFSELNVANGGVLSTFLPRIAYPTTATVLKRTFDQTTLSDDEAWTWLAAHNDNASTGGRGIYTLKPNATSDSIGSSNCVPISGSIGDRLTNAGTDLGTWGLANDFVKTSAGREITAASGTPIIISTLRAHNFVTGQPISISGVEGNTAANGRWIVTRISRRRFSLDGSASNGSFTANSGASRAVPILKTLIFGPGDYYLTSLQVGWKSFTRIVTDPNAYASGGTPGPVRFWIYDPSNSDQADFVQIPISSTIGAGAAAPDPSLFRIFYGRNDRQLQFSRPSGLRDIDGAIVTGDFLLFGGIYSVTKTPDDSLTGAKIAFTGTTDTNGGSVFLQGSVIADALDFRGPAKILFVDPSSPSDPSAGAGISGGYNDGG